MEELIRLMGGHLKNLNSSKEAISHLGETKSGPLIAKKQKANDRVFGFKAAFLLAVFFASLPITLPVWRDNKTEIVKMARSVVDIIDSEFEDLPSLGFESSELSLYQNTEKGFSFLHPATWQVIDSSLQKKANSSIVDIFVSTDGTDEYPETIFISYSDSVDYSFNQLISDARENILSSGFSIVNDQMVIDMAMPAHLFDSIKENVVFYDGKQIKSVRNYKYMVDLGSKNLLIEFQDDLESFEETSKKFVDLVYSIQIL